jgi:hypothetical protein
VRNIASIFRTTNDFYPEDGSDALLQDTGNKPTRLHDVTIQKTTVDTFSIYFHVFSIIPEVDVHFCA